MPADDEADADRTIIAHAPIARTPRLDVAHYLAITEAGTTRRLRIAEAGISLGRTAPNDIVVPEPEVSRKHCRIDLEGQWAVLADLQSTNGTFIDGHRIGRKTRLRNGNVITAGPFEMRYERRDAREVEQEATLTAELQRAADYVRAILPQPLEDAHIAADWWFVPSSKLGGDAFGYQYLDAETFAGFVLDVTGHGIGAAMHAVTVATALRRRVLAARLDNPAEVAAALNHAFPMEDHDGLMLTTWYFTYHTPTRQITYCAAGHHPAFLVAPGAKAVPLWVKSPAIGMLPHAKYTAATTEIPRGSRLYVFSDGAFEITGPDGRLRTLEDFRTLIEDPPGLHISEPERLYQAMRALARPGPLEDDFSVLVFLFP